MFSAFAENVNFRYAYPKTPTLLVFDFPDNNCPTYSAPRRFKATHSGSRVVIVNDLQRRIDANVTMAI